MSGLSISKRVCARANEVAVGQVNAGERWRFKAVGRWNDWFINCDADGYRIALFEFLGIRPQVRQARWFALVGWVGDSGTFAIGTGTEHTFEHTGMLTVCANDLSFMRWNNRGFVDLVAESVPPTPIFRGPLRSDRSRGRYQTTGASSARRFGGRRAFCLSLACSASSHTR